MLISIVSEILSDLVKITNLPLDMHIWPLSLHFITSAEQFSQDKLPFARTGS